MQILARDRVYNGFIKIDKLTLKHPEMETPFVREVMVRAPAACVLPVDLKNGLVLVIEEFRTGNLVADLPPELWTSLGVIAGMTEKGQNGKNTAWREAEEEAGIVLDADANVLASMTTVVSPGGCSEIIHHFVVETDLSGVEDGAVFGLDVENERTVVRVIPIQTLFTLMKTAQPINGLLATCALLLKTI